jgi:DNA polymerase-3 subunit gamma/tau
MALITRAAEGSVRDAMSLMDQAISHGAGETSAAQVRAMLGLADRGRVLDLFDMILTGDAAGSMSELAAQYADGADPIAVLRDLAEITHWVSIIKITPSAADDPTTPPDERARGLDMAEKLPMRILSRMWQMLLKSLEEVPLAPNSMMAAEMAVIRMTHVADLPDPEKLIRELQSNPQSPRGGGPAGVSGSLIHSSAMHMPPPVAQMRGPTIQSGGQTLALAKDQWQIYTTFEQVIDLIRTKRDMKLLIEVETNLRLARYSPGRIEFQPTPDAATDLAARLGQRLKSWTGACWTVSVVNEGGSITIAESRNAERLQAETEAHANPLVQAVLYAFPGTKITEIRTPETLTAAALNEALPEVEDEWDPFEDS